MASQERIEDAGEKIGGARKDFYKNPLSQTDLEQMNSQEKIEFITRDNIWSSKPLEVFQQEGFDCDMALFIRALRKTIPKHIINADHAALFNEFVTKVRDCTAHLKTLEALKDTKEEFNQFTMALIDAGVITRTQYASGTQCGLNQKYWDLFIHYPKAFRISVYLMSPLTLHSRSRKSYNRHTFEDRTSGNWIYPSQMNSDEMYEFIGQLNAKSQLQRKHTQAADTQRKRELNKSLSRPHLDHLKRVGLLDERKGRDIKPDDFLDTFGFRACEFGNWLPQKERQDVLNRAYDAFCTLACILDIDKKFLSLNGTLALAFGSRGKGKALAHYEPARKVINLTRLKGAGSLAHEFFHALDHHLGDYLQTEIKTLDGTKSQGLLYATTILSQLGNQLTSDHADLITAKSNLINQNKRFEPLTSTVNALFTRPCTESEAKITAEMHIASIQHQLYQKISYWLDHLTRHPDYEVPRSLAKQIVIDTCKKIREGCKLESLVIEQHPAIQQWLEVPPSTSPALNSSHVPIDIPPLINKLFDVYQTVANREAFLQSDFMKETFTTQYFKDAQALDKKRTKPYWATPHEIGARGFETYMQDSCAELGWRDDYLVHGTEEERFLGYEASPYPMGQDREQIRAAFNNFATFLRNTFYPSLREKEASIYEYESEKAQPAIPRPTPP